MSFDAVLLARASSARLSGADKPMLLVGGETLLARAVSAVTGADRVVVVGPRRDVDADVIWCQEQPPDGGPVAAVAAGLPQTGEEHVVVLACDLPFVAPAVPVMLAALSGTPGVEVAVLVDRDGRRNYLAAAWRRADLLSGLAGFGGGNGRSMQSLFAGRAVLEVPDGANWSVDCDTWDAVARARSTADG